MMVKRRKEEQVVGDVKQGNFKMLRESTEDCTLFTMLYQSETECDGRDLAGGGVELRSLL